MRYVKVRYNDYLKEYMFRIYMTDSIQLSIENKKLAKRYAELVNPQPQDDRTGDEIAKDVIERLGLKV